MDRISMLIGHKAGEKTALGTILIGITAQPQDYAGPEGDTAAFTVAAVGENLTYQWQYKKPGTEVWANSTSAAATTPTMTVEITAARDGQAYRCVVTSDGGEVTSSEATLSVETEEEEEDA